MIITVKYTRTYNTEKIWGVEFRFPTMYGLTGWSICKKYKTYQSVVDALRDFRTNPIKGNEFRAVKIRYDENGNTLTQSFDQLETRQLKLKRILCQ